MERLIVCKTEDGRFAVRPISWAGIWGKNGLLTNECNSIAYFEEEQDAKDYIAYRALGTVEELFALVKAREEGRIHIDPPPAKEGDPKPSCFYLGGGTIWCLGLAPDDGDEPCDRCKACWYCESGDYADDRTEAEAALSGGGGDG